MVRAAAGFASSLESFRDAEEEEEDDDEESEEESEEEDEEAMLAAMDREELCEMLRTTRQQLAQAAEMGQALMVELQQLELLRQEYAQLEEQKEELEASVEENEWRIEELEEGQARLQETVEEQDAALRQAETRAEDQSKAIAQLQLREGAPESPSAADSADDERDALGAGAGARSESSRAENGSGSARAAAKSDAKWRQQVEDLKAQLAAMGDEQEELIESKAQMEEARASSERERKKLAESVRKSEATLQEVRQEVAKEAAQAKKGFAVATKATDRANRLELQLRLLQREFKYLQAALQQPDKEDAVASRLLSLQNVFAESAQESEAATGTPAPSSPPPKRPTRDINLTIAKNELFPENKRMKLSVCSLPELEAVLRTKLKIEKQIDLRLWNRDFGEFVKVVSFDDIQARCKVEIVEKEEAPDAEDAVKAALEMEPEPEPEHEPEPGPEPDAAPAGAQSSHELERAKTVIEQLRIDLAAANADAAHCRKLTSAAQTELKQALGTDKYAEQEAKRRARMVENMEQRCKLRNKAARFSTWKDNVQRAKDSGAGASPEELEAAREAAKAEADARLREVQEAQEREMARVKQEAADAQEKVRQEQLRAAQRAEADALHASYAQAQLPIKECKCLSVAKIVGDNDKTYSKYRMEVHVIPEAGASAEQLKPWLVARQLAEFRRLKTALRSIPGKKKSPIKASFPGRFASEDLACGRQLEVWLNEALHHFRGQTILTEFLRNDGSDVAVADITMVRRGIRAKGDAGESSTRIQISRCKLEKSLGGSDGAHRMGGRTPLQKSQFLLSTSRAVEGMTEIKRHHILSVLTAPSQPTVERARMLRELLKDLQHPFVHRVHDASHGSSQLSKDEEPVLKVLVLRDYVNLGSVRDLLVEEKSPMRGFADKYEPWFARSLPEEGSGVTLGLVAKQVLKGMRYLETIGLPVEHVVHCGNVLVLSDGSAGGPPPCVAISDVEIAGLDMLGPATRHIEDAKLRRPADASVYAFGLLFHELASGVRADPDAKQWPAPDAPPLPSASMEVQQLLAKIFAPKNPADGISTLAQIEEHRALRDVRRPPNTPAAAATLALTIGVCVTGETAREPHGWPAARRCGGTAVRKVQCRAREASQR